MEIRKIVLILMVVGGALAQYRSGNYRYTNQNVQPQTYRQSTTWQPYQQPYRQAYQQPSQPSYQPSYQTAPRPPSQQAYQPSNQPSYQSFPPSAYQPTYQQASQRPNTQQTQSSVMSSEEIQKKNKFIQKMSGIVKKLNVNGKVSNQITNNFITCLSSIYDALFKQYYNPSPSNQAVLQSEVKKFIAACDQIKKAMEKFRQGNSNYISGNGNRGIGDKNVIIGSRNTLNGDQNDMVGDSSTIDGSGNVMLNRGGNVEGKNCFICADMFGITGSNNYIVDYDVQMPGNNTLRVGQFQMTIGQPNSVTRVYRWSDKLAAQQSRRT